jgi:hypothetical protein
MHLVLLFFQLKILLDDSFIHISGSIAKYEALFTPWGTVAAPCNIELDRRELPLTQLLSNCLARLRSLGKDRPLWADGICMNQRNKPEKEARVQLMRKIYFSAIKVLVQLGEGENQSDQLLDLL